MTERVGSWSGPAGWGAAPPGDGDPTGGRHAFDQDAALTPIFTTLRRDGWPRPRPPAGPYRPAAGLVPRPLRAVPDLVDDCRPEPPTALMPIVPPLYAVAREPVRIDPYAPASFAPPTETPVEATAWWRTDGYDDAGYDAGGYVAGGYDDDCGTGGFGAVEPAPTAWAPVYDGYDAAPRPVRYGAGPYAAAGYPEYDAAGYAADPHGSYAYGTAYDAADHGRYEPAPAPRRGPYDHRGPYDPVADSGRHHHHRLARAGW